MITSANLISQLHECFFDRVELITLKLDPLVAEGSPRSTAVLEQRQKCGEVIIRCCQPLDQCHHFSLFPFLQRKSSRLSFGWQNVDLDLLRRTAAFGLGEITLLASWSSVKNRSCQQSHKSPLTSPVSRYQCPIASVPFSDSVFCVPDQSPISINPPQQ